MTCKIVLDMTYNVFGGTLNLAQSSNPAKTYQLTVCSRGPVSSSMRYSLHSANRREGV